MMRMKVVAFGVMVLFCGMWPLHAVLADVQTVPSTRKFHIKVDPDHETMRSLRNSISRSSVPWNPESAIRLGVNHQVVSDDQTLQRLLIKDVENGKKPVFFVDKKDDRNIPGVFRAKTR